MLKIDSVEDGLKRIGTIRNHISLCEYLAARKEYLALRSAVNRLEPLQYKYLYNSLNFELGRCDDEIQLMLHKCEDIDAAMKSTAEPVEDTKWIFGSEHDGTTTHYILEYDGTMSLRVKGIVTDVPLFEQLCVIYEIGLYSKWVPFCSESQMLKQIGGQVFHLVMWSKLLML